MIIWSAPRTLALVAVAFRPAGIFAMIAALVVRGVPVAHRTVTERPGIRIIAVA